MKESLLVGLGGFVGSVARFQAREVILKYFSASQFPWSTFAVNIFGCFLAGLIATWLERTFLALNLSQVDLGLFLIFGFLGGFTTFSAFGLETLNLLRTGQVMLGMLNLIGSVAFGLLAAWVGMRIGYKYPAI